MTDAAGTGEDGMDRLVGRLGRLETGQVSDVLDEAGWPHHAIAPHIVPLAQGMRLAGRAGCARGAPIVAGRHAPAPLPPDAIEGLATPGAVIVLDTGGFVAGATIGGFFAMSLQRAGAAGFVSNGMVRDADEIRGLGFPLFCAGVTPVNAARRWRLIETGAPVSLPGQDGVPVRIRPGDLILGDGDGIVVVPAEIGEKVIEDAEELQRIEGRIGAEMRAGAARAETFGRNPRFAHIRKA